jgi:hypothetical protein
MPKAMGRKFRGPRVMLFILFSGEKRKRRGKEPEVKEK